jgi:hypothetical protein
MSRFNGFFTMVSKFRIGFWTLLLVSCTIIEDSDITSPSDYSKLKLKGFEIKQSTNKGEQTSTAQITINASGKIEKINWPAVGDYKFKFRTPISTSATSLLTHNSAGSLTTFDTQVGSQSVEKYDFLYNSTGQLIRLLSSGTFASNVVSTSDSLIYNAQDKLTKLERTTKNTTGANVKTSYNIAYQNDGALSSFSSSPSNQYELDLGTSTGGGGGYCPNNINSNECTRFRENTQSGPGENGTVLIKHYLTGSIVSQVQFRDTRSSSDDLDSYNFHPLMLMSSQFKQGRDLLSVYMIDWWIPGPRQNNNSGNNNNNNKYLNINFTYGL